MTEVEQLSEFVSKASYVDLSEAARFQLKIRVLDSIGCAIGAMGKGPLPLIREQVEEFGGAGLCTLIGGGRTAPDRAAFYNSSLVRYLDFNDGYLAKGETCHPSDNLGAVLAAAEYAHCSGKDFLAALAVTYQVQCRLSDVAPVRAKGFDHTTQGAYAVAAGVARALGLNSNRTANAIAISGTAFNSLRVTRTGVLSNWKGLAYPNTAFGATHAAFLAMRGITGPLEVFEGNKGFKDTISGPFEIEWSREDLERVTLTFLKKYNAELHSQSTLEGVLELKQAYHITADQIERIEIDIFDVAYNIIGGGEEGGKKAIRTKEEADHSLPYMVAVAILDGQVMPEEYRPERIQREDVQDLLRRVFVRPSRSLSQRFPQSMPCQITISLKNGQVLSIKKDDYEGFVTHPMSWKAVVQKFDALAGSNTNQDLRDEIVNAVDHLDDIPVAVLMESLKKIKKQAEP